MHRTITSDDVENYASHIPADEVKLNKEEDIMYQNGVLKYASGVTSCKLMPKVRLAHALALLTLINAQKIVASLGYSANYNLAIFVLVALHANVVNIPRARSQCLTPITVFDPLRLIHVNDSVSMNYS